MKTNNFLKGIIKTIIFITILFLLLGLVDNARAQDTKILGKFELGKDSLESLDKKIKFDMDGPDCETIFDGNNEYNKITDYWYKYNRDRVKIVLFLVNNRLYGVRYYPKDHEKSVNSYRQYLGTIYKVHPKDDDVWISPKVLVHREIDGDYHESFVHYDVKLLVKYPQYRGEF